MEFSNVRYADAEGTSVLATVDGQNLSIPVDPANRHYAALLAGNIAIGAHVPPPIDLAAYAAAKRYDVEVGGIVFGGLPLWTDRPTQSMLARVVQCLDKGMLTAPLKIKTPSGSLSLSQAEIEAVGQAVAQHVQQAFDVEADLADGIAGGTITTTAQIDAAPWPSNA